MIDSKKINWKTSRKLFNFEKVIKISAVNEMNRPQLHITMIWFVVWNWFCSQIKCQTNYNCSFRLVRTEKVARFYGLCSCYEIVCALRCFHFSRRQLWRELSGTRVCGSLVYLYLIVGWIKTFRSSFFFRNKNDKKKFIGKVGQSFYFFFIQNFVWFA